MLPWIADWPGKRGDTKQKERVKKTQNGNKSENTTLPENLFCPSSPAVSLECRGKTLGS